MSSEQSPRERERSLAGTYLRLAIEHLHAAGSAPALFSRAFRADPNPTGTFVAVAVSDAKTKQLDALRSAVLFSALAAEAYVNEFLARFLRGRDYEAVERMGTVNKYVIGTRLALGESLFMRTRNPAQTIEELFKLRHKLVHPKPGYAPPPGPGIITHQDPEFTPKMAAKSICMVAAAAAIMVRRAYPEHPFDFPANLVWDDSELIIDYASQVNRGLPERTAEAPEELLIQIILRAGPHAVVDESTWRASAELD